MAMGGIGAGIGVAANAQIEVGAEVNVQANLGVQADVGFNFSLGIQTPGAPSMAIGQRKDPYLDFRFAVEVEGLVIGGFSEVDGLQLEIEVEEYREGGRNGYTLKRTGPAKFSSNLTLKKGISDAETLSDWCWAVAQGTVNRKNISVMLLDENGQETVRWNFEQACPVKWAGPQLRGTGNEVAFESLEFVHKGFTRVL